MAIESNVVLNIDTKSGVQAMKEYRAEMRELRGQLVMLDAESEEYANVMQELANRTRDMADTNAEIRNSAMDLGQVLGNLGQIGGGLAASFGAVQGAMTLAGVESEELNSAFVKLQAIMAIAQGLNGLDGMIKSYRMLNIGLRAATLSQLGLNAAFFASPMGLLVAGVLSVIATLKIFNTVSEKSADAQKKLNNEISENAKKSKMSAIELDEYNKRLGRLSSLIDNKTITKLQDFFDVLNGTSNLTKSKKDLNDINYELDDLAKNLSTLNPYDLKKTLTMIKDSILLTPSVSLEGNLPLFGATKKYEQNLSTYNNVLAEYINSIKNINKAFNENEITADDAAKHYSFLTNELDKLMKKSNAFVKDAEGNVTINENMKDTTKEWAKSVLILQNNITSSIGKIQEFYTSTKDAVKNAEGMLITPTEEIEQKYSTVINNLKDLIKNNRPLIDIDLLFGDDPIVSNMLYESLGDLQYYYDLVKKLQIKQSEEIFNLVNEENQKIKDLRNEQIGNLKEFYTKIEEISLMSIKDEMLKSYAAIEVSRNNDLNNLKSYYDKVKNSQVVNKNEKIAIEEKYQEAIKNINIKYNNEQIEIAKKYNIDADAERKEAFQKELEQKLTQIRILFNKSETEITNLYKGRESNNDNDINITNLESLFSAEENINRKRRDAQLEFERERLLIIKEAIEQELQLRASVGEDVSALELALAQNSIDLIINQQEAKLNEQADFNEAVSQSFAQASESLSVISNAFNTQAQDKNSEYLASKQALNKAIESGDNEAIAREKKKTEQLDKEQKRAFKLYKTFAISQAVIDTVASAQGAYKSMIGVPIVGPVLAPIAAATATAAGLLNIRAIKNQQLNMGEDSITSSTPESNTPNINTIQPDINITKSFLTNEELALQKESQRVYVVESDIRQTGRRVSVVNSESSF